MLLEKKVTKVTKVYKVLLVQKALFQVVIRVSD